MILTRGLAAIVTVWLLSHMLYIGDEAYRAALRAVWQAEHGSVNYTLVLPTDIMQQIHGMKKKDFLDNHQSDTGKRPWRKVEEELESSLSSMFERNDPMKAWELKKMSSAAWQDAFRSLKAGRKRKAVNPLVEAEEAGEDISNILVYNRIPKSGSTLLLSLLYRLGERLGYLVIRGKYHSYRYFRENDRAGLGHFLSQASTRARTAYVQHQYFVNFTLFHQHQPIYINIMRDPVDHLISNYFYKRTVILQHRGPETMSPDEKRIMGQPIEECIVERRLECVYYGYTVHRNKTEQLEFRRSWSPHYLYPSDVLLYFCGHDEECTQLGNPAALQKAKHNVDKHFAVVGLLEHLDKTMEVLEANLPKFFTGLVSLHKELGSHQQDVKNRNLIKKADIPASLRAVLRSRLASEYDLYEHVRQKLFRQHAEVEAVRAADLITNMEI